MPAVTVSFTALPAHVRTARLIALATARRAGVDEDLIDEIRFAVGEACSRAVGINAAVGQPVVVTMTDEQDRFTVEVRDAGNADEVPPDLGTDFDPAALAAPEAGENSAGSTDQLPPGFGLAIISGLVESVDVTSGADGTTVTLTWPATDIMAPASE